MSVSKARYGPCAREDLHEVPLGLIQQSCPEGQGELGRTRLGYHLYLYQEKSPKQSSEKVSRTVGREDLQRISNNPTKLPKSKCQRELSTRGGEPNQMKTTISSLFMLSLPPFLPILTLLENKTATSGGEGSDERKRSSRDQVPFLAAGFLLVVAGQSQEGEDITLSDVHIQGFGLLHRQKD